MSSTMVGGHQTRFNALYIVVMGNGRLLGPCSRFATVGMISVDKELLIAAQFANRSDRLERITH